MEGRQEGSWVKDLIEVPKGEVVLVKTEEVAKFVEVGGADLFGKDFRVALGQVPKIEEIKDNARGWIGGDGVGFQSTGPFKQTEKIRLKPLCQNGRVRDILIESDDRFRGGAKRGGQAEADALDTLFCPLMEVRLQAMRLGLRLG